jgi:hypothetical protein
MVHAGTVPIDFQAYNSKTIQLAVGSTLSLSTTDEYWGPTTSSNTSVLAPQRARGVMPMYCIRQPVIGAYCPSNATSAYLAKAPGTAIVTGIVATCPSNGRCAIPDATTGGRFTLTVIVVKN